MSEPTWTIIGPPNGRGGPALVDRWGRITPTPGGPSLDFALQPDGGPLLTAATQPPAAVRQRMQGRLPVVATGWEWRTLRLATEAYACTLDEGPDAPAWIAVQAIVFNLSDDAARGCFAVTVSPHNLAGPSPIRRLAYRDAAFVVDGQLFAVCLPHPPAWDCSVGADDALPTVGGHRPLLPARQRATAHDPAGQCYGSIVYAYHIAPWEEAEFLAFLPLRVVRGQGSVVSRQSSVVSRQSSVVSRQSSGIDSDDAERRTQNIGLVPNPQSAIHNPQSPLPYRLIKGRSTAVWTARLRMGMQVRLPDDRLEESWAVATGHLLTLAGGGCRDPAVRAALAASGYAPADQQAAAYGWPVGPIEPGPGDWAGRMAAAARWVRSRAPGAGAAVQALFQAASPTFTWPAPPPPLPGSHAYRRAVAHWLLLLHDGLLFAEGDRLVLLAGLPAAWLARAGTLEVSDAPTPWGRLTVRAAWTADPDPLHLDLTTATPPPGGYAVWLPRPVARAELDGALLPLGPAAGAATATLLLPPRARSLRVYWPG